MEPKTITYRQSDAASEQGVCHTFEECVQFYSGLPADLKAPAVELLQMELVKTSLTDEVRTEMLADPAGWYALQHSRWGMHIRNLLRGAGYGEEYFQCHNLDDIYVYLLEEAVLGEARYGLSK